MHHVRKTMLPTLNTFNRGIMETVLKSCITALYGNCNIFDCNTLQSFVRTAEKITGCHRLQFYLLELETRKVMLTNCKQASVGVFGCNTHKERRSPQRSLAVIPKTKLCPWHVHDFLPTIWKCHASPLIDAITTVVWHGAMTHESLKSQFTTFRVARK